jgi:hypothetical protein
MIARLDRDWWVIYSREHNAWWAANSCGYVAQESLAGVYREADARQLVDRANQQRMPDGGVQEFMYPAPAYLCPALRRSP